jgi:hypothetical protein
MYAIAPPLKPDDSGDQVANLQAALLFLLDRDVTLFFDPQQTPTVDELKLAKEALLVEASKKLFDTTTRAFTLAFQQRQGLSPQGAGFVDKITADALNALLKGYGALQDADAYVVEGRVVDERERALAGAEVSLFDEDVTGPQRLGEPQKTGADGRYRFTFTEDVYLEGDFGLLAQPEAGASNRFYTALLRPTAPVIIASGPDIWVGIGSDPKSALARTEIVFNAGKTTVMPDLVVTRAIAGAGLSDLERVIALVGPRLKGVAMAALSDVQVEFLARDCEEPASLIRALVTAVRSDEEASKLAEKFGLVRPQGLELGLVPLQFALAVDVSASNLQSVLTLRDADVVRSLQDGIARNRIPTRSADETEVLVAWLREVRARHRLVEKGEKEPASPGQLLATLPDGLRLKDEALVAVARGMDHWGTDPEQFVTAVREAGLEDRQVNAVLRTLSLGDLTGAHVPLIRELQRDDPGQQEATLVDLAKLGRQEWAEVVKKVGPPPGSAEGPAAADTYVTTLIRGMESRAPTAFVLARVADGRIPLDTDVVEPAARFLGNSPSFRFGTDSVLTRFGEDGATAGVDDDQAQPLLQNLLKIERITRVAPSLETAEYVLAGGFNSALEISNVRLDDFVERMKDTLYGGEAEAVEIHDRARNVADMAFGIVMTASNSFNVGGEIALLSGTAPSSGQAANTAAGASSTTSASSTSSASTAAQKAQTATVEVLFGSQDACACDPCSAMGSPSHYLAELLMLLDRSVRNSAAETPLDVLLARRPDIAEIELDCDNTGHVMPYVDLLLELLEAPSIKEDRSTWIPRTAGGVGDQALDRGELPTGFAAALLSAAGIELGNQVIVKRLNPGLLNAPIWLLRGNGWRLVLEMHTSLTAYKYALYPQSLHTPMPESWAYPSQLMSSAYAALQVARYPWTLPFGLAQAETDVWLRLLGTSLVAAGEACLNPADPAMVRRVVGARLGLDMGDVPLLLEPGGISNGQPTPWRDWGYTSATPDPATPNESWLKKLERVSEFRQRAGVSHVEMLALLQCRFIQGSPGIASGTVLGLSGDDCDSTRMFLGETPAVAGRAALSTAVLRRVFLLVRLWRKARWSLQDLDRAISAYGNALGVSGIPPVEVLQPAFLTHLADLTRLIEQTALAADLTVALFKPMLDTHVYWRQDGSRAVAVPSTYEWLYSDPSLSRPRAPDFELNPARNELRRDPLPVQMPQLRLSDHVSVIAAAVGCSASDVLALLPQAEASIVGVELAGTAQEGAGIAIPASGEVVIDLVSGTQPANSTFEIRFETPDANGVYTGLPASEFRLDGNPITLPVTWSAPPPGGFRVLRYVYAPSGQRVQRLRVKAQRTSAAGSIWLSARVITAPGLVTDELNLSNLSLVTRHLLLARACKLDGAAYRQLLDISGAQPLSGPRQALEFLEQVRRIRGLGLNVTSLDELLRERFADARGRDQAQAQVCETLEALRRELAADDSDLAVVPGEAGALLRKVLVEATWPERLIELAMGPEFLGRSYKSQHSAKIDRKLPETVSRALPTGLDVLNGQNELRWTWAPRDSTAKLKEARLAMLALFQPGEEAEMRSAEAALDVLAASVEAVDLEINSQSEQKRAAAVLRLFESLELPACLSQEITQAPDISAVRSTAIPAAWSDTLWFDASRNLLCFRGLMTQAWRDELKRFSSATAYLKAIDEIFDSSNTRFNLAISTAATNLFFDAQQNIDQRAEVLLQRLLPMLRTRRANGRVLATLSPRLGVSSDVASTLVGQFRQASRPLVGDGVSPGLLLESAFVRSSPNVRITPTGFEPQYSAVRRLFKLAALAKASQLDGTETAWLMGRWPGLSTTLDFNALPAQEASVVVPGWPTWTKWTTLLEARQQLGQAGVLTGYAQAIEAGSFEAALRHIATWAGLAVDEVTSLVRGLAITTMTQLQEPARLQQLVACLQWMQAVGCDAASLIDWGTKPPSMAGAARARQFARAKLGEAAWPEASRQPLDALRLKRRDALVAYEVHRRDLRDANDLYGELLVDPEMGPCMKTTRIRLAISSVQLFVQRVLLGLEASVSPGAIEPKEWAWMQNYRMWEANLKVLLNSENYIDMSLWRDKTPPYRAVEAELMQGDASSDKAQSALSSYLYQLEEVSRLTTVGMYRSAPRNSSGARIWREETLSFIGRTSSRPYKYFARSYQKRGTGPSEGIWTSWKAIDLDLKEAITVTPILKAGELSLFWLEFREQAYERLPAYSQTGSPPNKYSNVTLHWSTLQGETWTSPKIISLDDLKSTTNIVVSQVIPAAEQFHVWEPDDQTGEALEIRVRGVDPNDGWGRDYKVVRLQSQRIDVANPSAGPASNLATIGYDFVEKTWPFPAIASLPDLTFLFSPIPMFSVAPPKGLRAAFSHQQPVRGFLATSVYNPELLPGQFAVDAGHGEILAQPYYLDNGRVTTGSYAYQSLLPKLHFSALHHSHASAFRTALRKHGLNTFFNIETQKLPADDWFSPLGPDRLVVPPSNYPTLGVDFSAAGSYSAYNAELFFMIPFAVACELSKQQRFREAREWFHYVFNPTTSTATPSDEDRYWNYLPFRKPPSAVPAPRATASIQTLVRKLANPLDQSQEKLDFLNAIAQWRVDPFNPHLVATMRPVAYKMAVVIAYVKELLIPWGDQLFRRDTMESLNEAAQFYILAAQILGRPGETIPPRTRPLTKAFAELRADIIVSGTNGLSNPLVAAESVLPVNSGGAGSTSNGILPKTLYFCVPANPVFKELRQTVQDRLFKMRNCMNIDGVARELALFDPPIDPAALVKARAAGVDVGALLADVSAPPPIYRFSILAQKASEICTEVKSLGAALLAAIEKGDGEALARLRSGHELLVLSNVRQMKVLQIEKAMAGIEALEPALESAQSRLAHYTGLLTGLEEAGVPIGQSGTTVRSLVSGALQTVSSTLTVTQALTDHVTPVRTAASEMLKRALARATEANSAIVINGTLATAKVPMNAAEKRQLEEMKAAYWKQQEAIELRDAARFLAMIPDAVIGLSGAASSPVITASFGGSLLSAIANIFALQRDAQAGEHSYGATLNSMLATYQRRAEEFAQKASAELTNIKEITNKMIAAAAEVAIAAQDLRNHDDQIANANAVDEFYRSKWSNQELYGWMSQQISGVYYRSYQLAYDMAKRAERAYRHELGLDSSDFVRFGHWDGMKKGLLAGELLFHDIKRMEAAYFETNARELEITRSISLRQLDSVKLMDLRITGQCSFELPEWLFNMDYPDHYMRRIKSVSVSLPCVVGPYTGVSGKLTMLSGRVRSSPTPGAGYGEDSNFRGINLASSSIAVSSAQGDAGLFEFNLRDERFLPFEGGGLVGSQWRFELPQHLRQFDYETISDLVLTIRYTARSSTALRQPAVDALNSMWAASVPGGLLIDLKRDYPAEWAAARAVVTAGNTTPFSFKIEESQFPYAMSYRGLELETTGGHTLWTRGAAEGSWAPAVQLGLTVNRSQNRWDVALSVPKKAADLQEALLGIKYKSQ